MIYIYIYIFIIKQKGGLLGAQMPDNMRDMDCPGWGWGGTWHGL